jgi:preprotein translocase subunit SecF
MREFILPIMFGLVAGTFSSVCIAVPTWALINKKLLSNKAKKKQSFAK